MKTQYLKIMIIGLALLFATQGCSLYAGFWVKQKSSPQSINSTKTAENVLQKEGAFN